MAGKIFYIIFVAVQDDPDHAYPAAIAKKVSSAVPTKWTVEGHVGAAMRWLEAQKLLEKKQRRRGGDGRTKCYTVTPLGVFLLSLIMHAPPNGPLLSPSDS
jgi:DNA-binding PadR family transcriptional regulator